MRKSLVLFAWISISLTSYGQQSADSVSTFTSKTELVLVPTVVVDGSGKHIPGLTKENFSILQDKNQQKIAFFEEVKPQLERRRVERVESVFSNQLGGDQTTARLTIFAFDMINTPFMGQAEARRVLLDTLAKTVDDGEPKAVVIFTRSGMKVLHDFTSDPAALARAVRRFRSRAPDVADIGTLPPNDPTYDRLSDFMQVTNTEYNEFEQRTAIESTDDCLRQIATAFSGVPGRKALLWATGGFPMLMLSQMSGRFKTGMQYISRYEQTWRMLNAANVAVYPIDVREVTIPGFVDASMGNMSRSALAWQEAFREQGTTTMVNYAVETGGKPCVGRNDFSSCFEEALQESKSYYMIGYYLDKKVKTGWHKLHVKTTAKGAHVRARKGVEVPDPARKVEIKNEYEWALLSPLAYTGVPMSVKWIGSKAMPEGKRSVEFELWINPGGIQIDETDGNHMKIELTAIGKNEKGGASGLRGKMLEARFREESAARIRREGFVHRNVVEVGPGEYNVRFVVRDHLSGRIGSVTALLKAQ